MTRSKREAVLNSTLLCFGAGSFTPGGFGYAPIPRKNLIRELVEKGALVLLTNEKNTTKHCSLCGEVLLKPTNKQVIDHLRDKNKWSKSDIHNVRCCTSAKHKSFSGSDCPCFFLSRDKDAARSIGNNGFKTIVDLNVGDQNHRTDVP